MFSITKSVSSDEQIKEEDFLQQLKLKLNDTSQYGEYDDEIEELYDSVEAEKHEYQTA